MTKTCSKPLKTPRYTAISDDSGLATGPSQLALYRSIDTFIGATETFLLTECDFYNTNAHNEPLKLKFAMCSSENFLYWLADVRASLLKLFSSKPFKAIDLQWCERYERMYAVSFHLKYTLFNILFFCSDFRELEMFGSTVLLFEERFTVVYSRS